VFYGWYVVAAAFAALFAGFGVAYSFGAFFLPLAADFGASRAEVSAVFSYAAALLFVTGALSGRLADRLGPRRVVAAGFAALTLGLAGSAAASSLAGVTICFALGVGLGVGFVYVPAIGAVQRWFVRRRGLASGIAVTGIGLGTLLMPLAVGWLLESLSWRGVFLALAALVAVSGVVAVSLLEGDPAARGLAPDGVPGGSAGMEPLPAGPPYPAVLRSRPFLQLYGAQIALSFAIPLPFVHLVPFAEDHGIERATAVLILGLVGLGSTLGRIVIGIVADRAGRRATLACLFAGIGLAYGVWLFAHGAAALAVFAFWFGTCYGGCIALMPALLADYFAGPRLGAIIGLQYTSAAFGSLLGPIAAGRVFDLTGSYTGALAGALLCAAMATALLWTTPPAKH
jgi:MFS family permease